MAVFSMHLRMPNARQGLRVRTLMLATGTVALALLQTDASGQTVPYRPTVAADGTAQVRSFDLPPSPFLSEQALDLQKALSTGPQFKAPVGKDIAEIRRSVDEGQAARIGRTEALFPSNMVETEIAGIPVRIFTSKQGATDPRRVLINLHGGGFTVCWDSCSRVESQPIAALTGFKVVSVNYRMAPEARHPAGVEDAAKVFSALAKTYGASHIGVYGCSAGGALTAQLAAWLPRHGIPQAGAVGIFGAGAVPLGMGDSASISAHVDGAFPPPAVPGEVWGPIKAYFSAADMDDPIVSAARHPDIMKTFPPSLIITGTRAMDMSPAVYTNSQLIKAGIPSTLIVAEGLGHCYINNAELPEAKDAYQAIATFFKKNL